MKIQNTVLFLVLNFAALGLGGYFIGDQISGEWYESLNKAPWTPPGWVFGTAWTVIMICFSLFLSKASIHKELNKQLFYGIFAVQLVLNIGWNWVFFKHQMILPGLLVISTLGLLILWFYSYGRKMAGNFANLLWPYIIWLAIAISLNAYIFLYN